MEYIKNIGPKKYIRGPTRWPRAKGCSLPPGRALQAYGPPGTPLVPIFCYMKGFDLEKIISELLVQSATVSRWNFDRTDLELQRSYSTWKFPSRRGKSKTSSSPTILSSRGGQSPSTSSSAPSRLQTLVHTLYPIFVSNLRLVRVGC